ncbi:MAG TPA: DUF86 domain-containing protein [Syntrophorhabdus sp.]|jgi:uncharacterized protein YutE (UPF0331/DUF86 family)|nr:MAG: hypothetical protein BWX92_03708 [Deltaproteobacteria bacterium ADurb.Bin135]HQI97398.1 DUF86 domain-containing protein [Syntrophorhabdus sp.]
MKGLTLVKQELVAERLERLREYIKILKAILKYDVERFKVDVFIHATAERYLQLSIKCLLDIGNHIISDRGYRKPDTYAEVFEILADEKILSKKLLRDLEGMAVFRNLLVHDYLRIDLDKVYYILQSKIPCFEKLGIVFGGLI